MATRIEGWPVNRSETITIGNPDSQIAIATLWTKRAEVVEALTPQDFAVIGQLYEAYGNSFVVRNLLANTHVRDLIVTGADLSGSGEALVALWKHGVDAKHNIVGIEKAPIHEEIPREAIDRLRGSVRLHDLREVPNNRVPVEVRDLIHHIEPASPWGEAEIYPMPSLTMKGKRPSEIGAHVVRGKTIGEAYLRMLREIWLFGEDAGTNYGNTARDLSNVVAIVTEEDPKNPQVPEYMNFTPDKLDHYVEEFFSAECPPGLFYLYGQRWLAYHNMAQTMFEEYRAKIIEEHGIALPDSFAMDGMTFQVGQPRNIDQAEIMLTKLRRDPNDRGVVGVLYDPWMDNQSNKDAYMLKGFSNPCLVFFQAAIKSTGLELSAYFRSNDMYGAWPRNAFGLRAVQGWFADQLGVPMGPLTTISNRAHIYSDVWPQVDAIIKSYGDKMYGFEEDERGNFIVSLRDKEFLVSHMSPHKEGGMPVEGEITGNALRNKAALAMGRRLIREGRVHQPENALDLGIELACAELAARTGINYTQDNADLVMKAMEEMANKSREYDRLKAEGLIP